jgi:hypothetical protein
MRFPADPAKNKYVRDYQVIEFEGPGELSQGQLNTYLFNFPFRFIAEEMVCEVIFQDQSVFANQTFTPFSEPPILTQMKYHSTFIDDQPIALRAAWGTALRPAKLSIPWAVEQGTNISVDAQFVLPFVGPIVIFGQTVRLIFSLRGYQPSDEEFAAVKNRNDQLCVRPYQSFTFSNRSGLSFMIAKDPAFAWDENPEEQFNIDFPMDIFVVKNVASAFDIDNLDANNFPTIIPNPMLTMTYVTKSANLFSTRDVFRNIFGTAEFPTTLQPNQQYKQGDFARLNLRNNSKFKVAPFMSIVGYAPKPGTIRRGDIQRGRVKPEQFDPQPMIGGKV